MFTNASQVFADSCAQHVLAMMLALGRNLIASHRDHVHLLYALEIAREAGMSREGLYKALSADGKALYFTSDMPGGLGGTDIYVCRRVGAGWGDRRPRR